ncbi:hypothetical protein [Rhizobium hidalgonense]|uniref:hypothetical protein n=1 Tax=Rhizobium hidalgonense TaxID=1538159 RepID=UPI0011059F2D|nr:hypothetical protein [Rhizobium hidalgonense]MDR9805680.1 hypothetical protein [Rhizobium hidalgonense]QKK26811.1 hypothetical protein FFM81_026220 [Rhizobium hidalgonense]
MTVWKVVTVDDQVTVSEDNLIFCRFPRWCLAADGKGSLWVVDPAAPEKTVNHCVFVRQRTGTARGQ